MRPGSTPSLVNPVMLFQQATCTNLQLSSGTHRHSIKGSLSKDGKVCWMYSGSILEVVATDTQNRLAAWNFGVMLHDSEVVIQSVAEFWAGDSLRLLVGLKNSSIAGLVCVLNVNLSRVVKAIEIPFKVTSIECITSLLGNDFPVWAFSEHLSCFYGIVAVGTEGGHVYLIDMCLDTHDQSDEMFPNTLHYISPDTEDVVQTRHEALSQRQVLCMELGMDSFSLGSFNYHSNDEAIMKQFKTDEICVTCLKYMSRNGLLAVGYNFGCFQLWRLSAPILEYSSRLDDSGNVPITHIAYQEPENDPKNFSYIWVSRGPLGYSSEEGYLANITLYQLSFNKRMWYSNKECFYEEMSTIGIRLEHDLSSDPLNSVSSKMSSSNVISCYTLEDPYFFLPVRSIDDSHEETSCNPDLSLCVFVWRADNGSKSGTTSYHLAIFDMNRWYHAQMPSNIRTLGNTGICPYMAFCSLDEVIDNTIPDELLCAYINPSTVRKFISDPSLIQEQFFYPSSLQFDVLCLMESGLVNARFLGMQRQVLSTIQKLGPSSLIDPNELYRMCLFVGLVHRTHDAASTHTFSLTNSNREAILSLCLEHHLINVITKSVEQWADGEYLPQGCTLKFLLDWTWNKVVQIKQCVDNTCKPFYDWSGLPVDEQCVQVLHHCLQKLYYLTHILQRFIHTSAPITENGIEELSQKFDAVQLLSHHLKAVIWFVESGLLPENDELASYIPGLYRYPRTSLIEVFMKRREELQQLHSDVKTSELLMIDGLIENTSPAVRDLWQQDGGDGQYPPPSINALINFYLLDGVPLLIKHCVISYFLLDLASLEDDSNVKLSEKVATFADVFSVPSDTMNLITGFWLLDHKDFEVAFSFLVNSPVFGPWQHKQVIKALLYQNEGKLALRYLAVKQPPLSSPEEVKLKLTTFLVNGMTAQAVEFQRTCCDQNNAQDLISHIFLGCQQTKTMNQLLKLPLTELEEKWLENYLLSSMESHSEELLVMYYLQRARFVDAIRLNERLKTKAFGMMTAKDRERASTRNAIVNGCAKLLPEVQQQLIFEPAVLPRKMNRDIAVPRPKPLSTMVTKSNPSKLISQSTFVLAVMEKMQEVAQVEDYTNNGSFDEFRQRPIEPFISTPITPKKKTPLSDLSKVIYERNLVDEQKAPGLRLSPSSPPTMAANFFSYGATGNKRPSKYVSAEASSLLQTPIIQRKTTPRTHITSPRPTPQSILKVRQISNKSPNMHGTSPLSIGDKGKDVPEPRPALRLSKLNLTLNDSTGSPFGASAKKTKLLRFAEPTLNSSPVSVDDSPTPSSSNAFPSVTARVGLTERKSLSEMIQAERYPPSESVIDDDTFEMDTEMMEEDDDDEVADQEEEEEVVVETKEEEGTYMATHTKDEDISDEINNSIETEADENKAEEEDEEEAMEVEEDMLPIPPVNPPVQELVDSMQFQPPNVTEEDLAFVKNTITLTEEEEEAELMVCKDEQAVIIPDYLTPSEPIDLTEDDEVLEVEEEEEEEFKPFKSADIIELAPLGQKTNVSQQVEEYHSNINVGSLVYEEQQEVGGEPLYGDQYMEEEDIPRDKDAIATEMLERERDDVQIITEAVLPVVQPISQEFKEAEKEDLDIVEIGEEEEEEEEEHQQVVEVEEEEQQVFEVEDEEELEELQLVEVEEEEEEEEDQQPAIEVEEDDEEEEEDQQQAIEIEKEEEDQQAVEVEEEESEEEDKEQDVEEEESEEEDKEQDIEVEEEEEENKEQDIDVEEVEGDKEQDIEVEEEVEGDKEQDIEVEEEEEGDKEQDIDVEEEEEGDKEQDIEVAEEKEGDKEQDIEVEEEEEGDKEQDIEVEEVEEENQQQVVEEEEGDKEKEIEVEEEEEEGDKEQAIEAEEKALEEEDREIEVQEEGVEENRIEMVKDDVEEKMIELENVPEVKAGEAPIPEPLMGNDVTPEMAELPAPPSPSQSATTRTSSQSGSSPSSTSSSPPVYTRRTLRSKVKAESKDANRSEAALVPTMTQPVSEEMTMPVDIAPETPSESAAEEVVSETISTRSTRRGPSRSSESRLTRKKASQKSLKSKLESVKKAFLEEIGNISEDSSSEKNLQEEDEKMAEVKVSVQSEAISSEISKQDEKEEDKEEEEEEEVYSQVKTRSTRSSRSGTPTRRSSRLKTDTPSRGTTPTRTTPIREVGPSRGATPTREVIPSRGATPTREVGRSRGTTPTREVDPLRGATPTREVDPSRGATPTREVDPLREATPTREVDPSRGATQTRSLRGTTPTREAGPSRGTTPTRETGPSRGTTPTRETGPSRGTTPIREVGSSRRTRGTTPPREIVATSAPEVNPSLTVQPRVLPVRATRGGQSAKVPQDDERSSKDLVNIKIKTEDEIKVEMEETMPESEPQVRTTRRTTRKTAALKSESQLITDTESVLETPSNQQKPFVFCPPVIRKKTQKRESSKKNPKTEDSSIIFSSTRSHRSALKKDPFIQEEEEEEMAVDIPMEEPPLVSATTSSSKTPVKTRSTRKKVYLVKTTDSPIVNLLTPSRHKTEPEEKETTRTAQSRILRKPAHSMVLRTKTAVKKRKL